jgi:hypothetical protein
LYDWPIHMAKKFWVDVEAFIEAFSEALRLHRGTYKGEVDPHVLEASISEARREADRRTIAPQAGLHMPVIEARFKLEKETEGALRYQEVDEKGEAIEQAWAKIGTLYVRKSAFEPGAVFPQTLRVTVESVGP